MRAMRTVFILWANAEYETEDNALTGWENSRASDVSSRSLVYLSMGMGIQLQSNNNNGPARCDHMLGSLFSNSFVLLLPFGEEAQPASSSQIPKISRPSTYGSFIEFTDRQTGKKNLELMYDSIRTREIVCKTIAPYITKTPRRPNAEQCDVLLY